jgi:hypothetical protein
MLSFEPNYWYVYILHNKSINCFYIGLHHQVGSKSYTHSSSSIFLQKAIEDNFIDEYIVYKGESKEKAHALETYLINLAKNNAIDLYNKNSGGGHRGGARQNILEEKDYIVGENMIIHNIFPEKYSVEKYEELNLYIEKLAKEVQSAVVVQLDTPEKVIHKVTYEPVDRMTKMEFLQVTENHIDPREVDKVAESMMRDPIAAVRKVEPCTIIEYPDGREMRLDGTTTVHAVEQCQIWPTVPVVRFKSSVFNDSNYLMRNYASARNIPEKYNKAQDPKKELPTHIHIFHMDHKELFEESFEDFCECFKALYYRKFSPKALAQNLKAYKEKYEEDEIKGDNWVNYAANKLIDKFSHQVKMRFPKSEVSKSSFSSLHRDAISNPANYFGSTGASQGKNAEVILAYHTQTKTENRESEIFEMVKNNFAFYNFFPDKSKAINGYVPFVGKHNGYKVFIVSLPARYDTTRKGNMIKNIVNMLFDEQQIAA